jgi:CRP-like cAMP-binding protein
LLLCASRLGDAAWRFVRASRLRRPRLALCALPDSCAAATRVPSNGRYPEIHVAAAQNSLIARLPVRDRVHFLKVCERVELVMSDVLCESGSVTRFAYFPTEGFVSLIAPLSGEPVLEVGMVGCEGMVGTQLVLGVATVPLVALVQGAGAAWRVTPVRLRSELAHSKGLRDNLARYVQVTIIQLASSAACLRFHQLGQRLARWLLMTHDRAHADSFHVTHEFLAYMLGVRRVGVTTAAISLQRLGLIEYRRGDITILNRRGLEAAACSCYATDKQAYLDVMH